MLVQHIGTVLHVIFNTSPTSKYDENVGEGSNIFEHVGVMDLMLAKHTTSMSNRPNMLRHHVCQHVGTVERECRKFFEHLSELIAEKRKNKDIR